AETAGQDDRRRDEDAPPRVRAYRVHGLLDRVTHHLISRTCARLRRPADRGGGDAARVAQRTGQRNVREASTPRPPRHPEARTRRFSATVPGMRRWSRGHDREAFRAAGVVILLLASLVLAMVLAWQAADAARSHRAATGAVLRDFAALAGGEFVRRVS